MEHRLDKPRYIDVLSDSTGETAEKVVRAALLQFPQAGAPERLPTPVRPQGAAPPRPADLKTEAIDVIGSLIGKLGTFLEREPINLPSAMLPLSEEYFRRIE